MFHVDLIHLFPSSCLALFLFSIRFFFLGEVILVLILFNFVSFYFNLIVSLCKWSLFFLFGSTGGGRGHSQEYLQVMSSSS